MVYGRSRYFAIGSDDPLMSRLITKLYPDAEEIEAREREALETVGVRPLPQ
jgi:hypothetical protein